MRLADEAQVVAQLPSQRPEDAMVRRPLRSDDAREAGVLIAGQRISRGGDRHADRRKEVARVAVEAPVIVAKPGQHRRLQAITQLGEGGRLDFIAKGNDQHHIRLTAKGSLEQAAGRAARPQPMFPDIERRLHNVASEMIERIAKGGGLVADAAPPNAVVVMEVGEQDPQPPSLSQGIEDAGRRRRHGGGLDLGQVSAGDEVGAARDGPFDAARRESPPAVHATATSEIGRIQK